MKRSEAVTKIETFFERCYESVDPAIANDVLDFFETEIGMLPPDQNADAEPPCWVVNEWEPEGDE